jgi:hypothetical protein
MDYQSLLQATSSGYVVQQNTTYSPRTERGKVYAVRFYNQGTNSNIMLEYGGVQIIMTAATNNSHEGFFCIHGYDTTEQYKISFSDGGGGGARVDKCVIQIWKYVENE